MKRSFQRLILPDNKWVRKRATSSHTNTWMREFATMALHLPGVRKAMIGLVGLYVYDYKPDESVAAYANDAFARADDRLIELLNNATRSRSETEELMVIIIFLSMQDVSILTNHDLSL